MTTNSECFHGAEFPLDESSCQSNTRGARVQMRFTDWLMELKDLKVRHFSSQ